MKPTLRLLKEVTRAQMHFHFALGNRKNPRPPLNNLGPLGVVDVLTNSEDNDLFLDFSKNGFGKYGKICHPGRQTAVFTMC